MVCVFHFRHYTIRKVRYHAGYRNQGGEVAFKLEIFGGGLEGRSKKISRGGVDRCNKRITSKKRISNFGNRTARESPECGLYNAKFIFYLCRTRHLSSISQGIKIAPRYTTYLNTVNHWPPHCFNVCRWSTDQIYRNSLCIENFYCAKLVNRFNFL